MSTEPLPILYTGVYQKYDGHEGSVDLEEPGWLNKMGLREARIFTLQPKPGSGLPVISVHLNPLSDGTKRELVLFSRVFARFGVNSGACRSLFRLYCIGWKAKQGDSEIVSVNWIYPSGSIVAMAGEKVSEDGEDVLPPYVQELAEHYATKDFPVVA